MMWRAKIWPFRKCIFMAITAINEEADVHHHGESISYDNVAIPEIHIKKKVEENLKQWKK